MNARRLDRQTTDLTRVCLVTSAPVSQNPRVVKEADALAEAGYDVLVSFARTASWTRQLDDGITGRSAWLATCLDASLPTAAGRRLKWETALRTRAGRTLVRLTSRYPIPELAYCRFFQEQRRRGASAHADLYIGHNPQSLPIVAAAARAVGAKYAFDAEDLHSGEFRAEARGTEPHRLVELLERRYLPDCAYVTAAAPGIARALASKYGIAEPTTVLNAFPWGERAGIDGAVRDRAGSNRPVSFYWYSQIVGPDRGLQDAIAALSYVPENAELHIRGGVSDGDRAALVAVAEHHHVGDRVRFHTPVAPEELLSRAAEHDVGLALEQPISENKNVCISNKLFLYLLAGIAVVATRTAGQQEILREEPRAAVLYEPGDVQSLGARMREIAENPSRRAEMRAAALAAARDRWNWEIEKVGLVGVVNSVLNPHWSTESKRRAVR